MMKFETHAVIAQRIEPADSRDDFPTPPWATRALLEHVLDSAAILRLSCLEPACGRGHMAEALSRYFASVRCADAFDYGFAPVKDFTSEDYADNSVDWVVTNPPFKLAETFILKALKVARHGVAILARTQLLEGIGRYRSIYSVTPPATVAIFTERVPMFRGRLDATKSTATSYSWFVWTKPATVPIPLLQWIPPCRKALEREGDYSDGSA